MQHIIDTFVQRHKRPQLVNIQKGKKVLVLAPHPDDEVIGAGGSLLKHRDYENEVHIVFITDGSNGRTREQSIEETIRVREKEAINLCNVLSADYSFLKCKDGEYIPEQSKIQWMRKKIESYNPTDIYLPHLDDSHRDHFMTNILFFEALNSLPEQGRNIWQYEVWSPVSPNIVINISNEFERKRELMLLYESQLQLIPYDKIMEGLNKYRVATVPLPGIEYIEAFYHSDEQEYKNNVRRRQGE
ncbi:LmbE family N-acetylglucosaminyl deacetylase [Bacillus thermophilus]|uniref:LmbE family N-acetylglucosaminyl deacetylase n=1 Tax=Siminovitchia thermophila TaxID=1245522 RepID=A0ABS2RAH4_9BACI|nr:PIG-L family deacetylase [Siminovitchia thermophila]MBM7716594.1 LmbE family N-acetylglucosaminyl deacetylase [Siminovitchia thermophila]ONK21514.1 hypothetical protein BLX87_21935 [Bacillus sp. VT-16-64]